MSDVTEAAHTILLVGGGTPSGVSGDIGTGGLLRPKLVVQGGDPTGFVDGHTESMPSILLKTLLSKAKGLFGWEDGDALAVLKPVSGGIMRMPTNDSCDKDEIYEGRRNQVCLDHILV